MWRIEEEVVPVDLEVHVPADECEPWSELAIVYRAAAVLHAVTLWTRTVSDTP